MSSAERRMTHVANHILLQNRSPISSTVPSLSPSPVSANSTDTYQRVHGEVSIEPVTWIASCDEYGKEFTDIVYEKADGEGIAKVNWSFCFVFLLFGLCMMFIQSSQITINRPERRNAFRPHTVKELMRAFNDARDDASIGVIILTGMVIHSFLLNSQILFVYLESFCLLDFTAGHQGIL